MGGRFLRFVQWDNRQGGHVTLKMDQDRALHAEFEEVALQLDLEAAVPQDVVATRELLTVHVEWQAVEGASYYLLYYRLLSAALYKEW